MKRKLTYVLFIVIIGAFSFREFNRYGAVPLPASLQWWGDLDKIIFGFMGPPHSDGYAIVNYVAIMTMLFAIGVLRLPKPKPFEYDEKDIPEDVGPIKISDPAEAFKDILPKSTENGARAPAIPRASAPTVANSTPKTEGPPSLKELLTAHKKVKQN